MIYGKIRNIIKTHKMPVTWIFDWLDMKASLASGESATNSNPFHGATGPAGVKSLEKL